MCWGCAGGEVAGCTCPLGWVSIESPPSPDGFQSKGASRSSVRTSRFGAPMVLAPFMQWRPAAWGREGILDAALAPTREKLLTPFSYRHRPARRGAQALRRLAARGCRRVGFWSSTARLLDRDAALVGTVAMALHTPWLRRRGMVVMSLRVRRASIPTLTPAVHGSRMALNGFPLGNVPGARRPLGLSRSTCSATVSATAGSCRPHPSWCKLHR